jgi:hypothetical protein
LKVQGIYMTAYLETLAPVDIVFLASALMSALDFLVWTVWLSLKGGIRGERASYTVEEGYPSRTRRIFHAVIGFEMAFGVIGLALRRLLAADPVWALLGAVVVGVLAAGIADAANRINAAHKPRS